MDTDGSLVISCFLTIIISCVSMLVSVTGLARIELEKGETICGISEGDKAGSNLL